MNERHVLGISGGKDSAALAVYMRQTAPDLNIEYFFTDTGKELPEVYEFLGRLEGFLGKSILRLNPDRDFDFWLQEYNNFLPSPQTRWCTRQLKIKPFEEWLRPALASGDRINSYVAIRSDEDYREGYISGQENLKVHLPFRKAGIDKAAVHELLEAAGLGLPDYYRWRSRSGCTFCFYQQKIEWARLLEEHPSAFDEAKRYEKNALDHGSPFTWSHGESLDELARPERLKQIRQDHAKRVERLRARRPMNILAGEVAEDLDEVYGTAKMCVTCHK
jgi:3'-phosphoadenosine 5'-phosphosulfate sulfotransferase (PAPS reductase)/FAD synthetase